jgi:hypothetical protein
MADRRLILCGSARLAAGQRDWAGAPGLRLRLGREKGQVHLRLDHLTRGMCANAPDEAVDLLEVAAYVYAADQAVTRGGTRQFDYGGRWRRHFRFEIPVRKPELWKSPAVADALSETLGFLSDDDYEFGFTRLADPPPLQRYLFDEGEGGEFEEAVLFSGGLDALGGAVLEVLRGQRRVVLVSHRPVSKIYARQCKLVQRIAEHVPRRDQRPLHLAVEVNAGKGLGREFTQRARSFLFAATAAAAARMCRLSRIRFYENGVVSLNLPLSPQVLGGRATRTTHPKTLYGFERLFSALFGRFRVENPFQWETKAGILAGVRAAGHGGLCGLTSSCAHTFEQTIEHSHCGRCTQCVDRRLTALAAGLTDAEDPAGMYASDVLTGPRDGADLIVIERYVGTLLRAGRFKDARSFLAAFPEVSRALPHVGLPAGEAAERIRALYARHAEQVSAGLAAAVRRESDGIVQWRRPANCLLSIVCGRGVRARASGRPQLTLDAATFEARLGSNACFLGNTMEWRLLARLNRRPGAFVSIDSLRDEVWEDSPAEKYTIQRTASNLRRKLRDSGMAEVVIDGSQKDYYRVLVGG